MREKELKDIHIRLTNILNNNRFKSRINTANNNWLEIHIKDVINNPKAEREWIERAKKTAADYLPQ